MDYDISRVEVWSGEVRDRRGALADILKVVLAAGANLDFMIARPSPVKPNTGILYLAPLEGETLVKAARDAGLYPSSHVEMLRVEGPDRPGLAQQITRTISDADINMSGFTGGRMANRCVFHLRFERADELDKAHELLKSIL